MPDRDRERAGDRGGDRREPHAEPDHGGGADREGEDEEGALGAERRGSGPARRPSCRSASRRSRSRRGARRSVPACSTSGTASRSAYGEAAPSSITGTATRTSTANSEPTNAPAEIESSASTETSKNGRARNGTIASSTAAARTILQRPAATGRGRRAGRRTSSRSRARRGRRRSCSPRRSSRRRRTAPSAARRRSRRPASRCRPRRPARRGTGSAQAGPLASDRTALASIRSRSRSPWPALTARSARFGSSSKPRSAARSMQLLPLGVLVGPAEDEPAQHRDRDHACSRPSSRRRRAPDR